MNRISRQPCPHVELLHLASWRGLAEPKASAQLAMPPAQKPTGAEGAARALPREQPVTAAAVTPTPVNNESAGAEGAEFITQDLPQDPPGNDDLLRQPVGPARL